MIRRNNLERVRGMLAVLAMLAISVAAAEGSSKDSYGRSLQQEMMPSAAAATPAATMPAATPMMSATTPMAENATIMPINATGNVTDDRSRRGGGAGGGGGDGRGNTGSTRAVYCGSIACLRRKLLQAPEVSTVPAAAGAAPAMPAVTAINGMAANATDTMMPANGTGNVTDDRSRRGGGPGGGGGDGRGNTGSTRAVYCGSIACLRRKLLQAPEVATVPAAAAAAPAMPAMAANKTMAGNTTGIGMLNATMNGTLMGLNVTNGTDDRSRRRNSCSEGACGPPPARTPFGV